MLTLPNSAMALDDVQRVQNVQIAQTVQVGFRIKLLTRHFIMALPEFETA
jgi:hypothetical protein